MTAPGRVFLVGAGPGAADLITVRGLRRLRAADVVVYDRLVEPDLLAEAPAAAERILADALRAAPGGGQRAINELLVARARSGRDIVRLKGGDPMIYGRGAEEAEAVRAAGFPVEIVPGLSSATAVPAHAGIALTRRGVARSFAVITGQTAGEDPPDRIAQAARADTVVVLMGVARLPGLADALCRAGRAALTPVTAIERGTTAHERRISGTLADIAARAAAAHLRSPAVIVVGEVAGAPHDGSAGRQLGTTLTTPTRKA